MKATIHIPDIKQYYPGDQVQGELQLKLEDETDIKDIKIWIRGKVHTSITVRSSSSHSTGSSNHHHNTTYKDKVKLYKNVLNVWDVESGPSLEPNSYHVFPFIFQIPMDPNLPASFALNLASIGMNVPTFLEKQVGRKISGNYVSHSVCAKVNRTGLLKKDQKPKVEITVLAMDTTPAEPIATVHDLPMRSYFCRNKGSVNCSLELEKNKVVPGQTFKAVLSVKNNTNAPLRQIHVCVWKRITYRARGHISRNNSIVCDGQTFPIDLQTGALMVMDCVSIHPLAS